MIKPWHISVLVILLVMIGVVVLVVRAFNKGKRGD